MRVGEIQFNQRHLRCVSIEMMVYRDRPKTCISHLIGEACRARTDFQKETLPGETRCCINLSASMHALVVRCRTVTSDLPTHVIAMHASLPRLNIGPAKSQIVLHANGFAVVVTIFVGASFRNGDLAFGTFLGAFGGLALLGLASRSIRGSCVRRIRLRSRCC